MTKKPLIAAAHENETEKPPAKHRTLGVRLFATIGVLFAVLVGGALVALIANENGGVSHLNHVKTGIVETNR